MVAKYVHEITFFPFFTESFVVVKKSFVVECSRLELGNGLDHTRDILIVYPLEQSQLDCCLARKSTDDKPGGGRATG